MLISIIIPTINRTEKLKKLIKNIIDQNNDNIEVIIIDQSDKENVSEFLHNKLINYIWVPRIRNLSDARNYGIKYAKGDYIGFLDDDLTLSDQFITRLFQTIKENNFFIFTGIGNDAYNKSYFIFLIKMIFYRGIFYDRRILYKGFRYPEYINTNKIIGGCTFYKKEVFNSIRYRKNSPLFINEDTDFSLMLKKKINKDFFIDTKLIYYHDSETKTFNTNDAKIRSLFNKLNQNIISSKILYEFHGKKFIDRLSLFWLKVGYLGLMIYLIFKYRNFKYMNISLKLLFNL